MSEQIKMIETRMGYFPARFTWCGQSYRVHAIHRCWVDDDLLHFDVTWAIGERVELVQNTVTGKWTLERGLDEQAPPAS